MKRLIIAAILVFGFATPALAGHCPRDIKKIEAALAEYNNPKARMALNKGRRQHKEGKHNAALLTLHRAMQIVKIRH